MVTARYRYRFAVFMQMVIWYRYRFAVLRQMVIWYRYRFAVSGRW